MIQSIISFFSDLAMFMLLLVVIFTVFAACTIAPKYEKLFSKVPVGLFDYWFPDLLGRFISRPAAYMTNIALGNPNHRKNMNKLFFGDYDFRAQAKLWEIVYSRIFFCFGMFFIFSIGIVAFLYYGGRLFGLDLTIV